METEHFFFLIRHPFGYAEEYARKMKNLYCEMAC